MGQGVGIDDAAASGLACEERDIDTSGPPPEPSKGKAKVTITSGKPPAERLLSLGFTLQPLSEVSLEDAVINWIWDGLIARGALSLLVSPPRGGKTYQGQRIFLNG